MHAFAKTISLLSNCNNVLRCVACFEISLTCNHNTNIKVFHKHDKIAPFLFVCRRIYTNFTLLNMSMRLQNSYIWQVLSAHG